SVGNRPTLTHQIPPGVTYRPPGAKGRARRGARDGISLNTFPHSRGVSPPSGVLVQSTERASPSSPRKLCAFLTGPLSWPTRDGSPAWSTSEGVVHQHRQRIS